MSTSTSKREKFGKGVTTPSPNEQGHDPARIKKKSSSKADTSAHQEGALLPSTSEKKKRSSDSLAVRPAKRARQEDPTSEPEEGETNDGPDEISHDGDQNDDEVDTSELAGDENDDGDGDEKSAVQDSDGPDALNNSSEVKTSSIKGSGRIPKKIRRDYSSDEDSPRDNQTSTRVTHTVATLSPPPPLDYVIENGRQVLTNAVVRAFFSALRGWRNDTSHFGPQGTIHRNEILISPQVRAWLDNMSGDPDTNKTGRPWQEFDDNELADHIIRWNGEKACGPSNSINVVQAINNMYQYRLINWMTSTPDVNHTLISNCRAAVMEGLAASQKQWNAAVPEQKKKWVIRLLQILLDPRVKTSSLGQPLPRMDAQSIPAHLVDNAQMAICLFAHEIIKGSYLTDEVEDFWARLNLQRWHPGDPNFVEIDEPGKLFDFLSKVCRSANSLAATMQRIRVKYELLFPSEETAGTGKLPSGSNSAQSANRGGGGNHPRSQNGNKHRSGYDKLSSNGQHRSSNNTQRNTGNGNQPAGQKNASTNATSTPTANNGSSNSTTASSTASTECYICGRSNHAASNCRFTDHVFRNQDPRVRWVDSNYGALYRQKDPTISALPPNRDPFGNELKVSGRGNNIKGMSYLTALINDLQNCTINATVHFSESRLQTQALIDSGANSSDYVSTRVFKWLRTLGMDMEPLRQPSFVNGAWMDSSCSIVGTVASLNISVINDFSQPMTLELHNVKIIEGNFDIIIGLPTIRKYDLTVNLRSLFAPENKPSRAHRAVVEHIAVLQNLPDWLAALTAVEKKSKERFTSDKKTSTKYSDRHYVEFAKEDLLDLLYDDDENPEWKPEISELLPQAGEKLDDEALPEIQGNGKFQSLLRKILHANREVFSRTIHAEPALIEPMSLELEEGTSFIQGGPPRPQSIAKQKALIEQINNMLRLGVIVRSQATNYSQVVMVQKPHQPGKWRFCVDYRQLNEKLKSMGWPIPNIDRLFARLGSKKARYFAVLDLTSGYHQVLLDQRTRHLAAFVTDYGVFEPVRLWMGIKSAPSYFQQHMTRVLHGLLYDICEIYIDDIIIYGRTEEEFASNLDKVLRRLREHNLTLNPDKAKIGLTQLEYVGRVINEHGVIMSDEKIRKVVEFPLPRTPHHLKKFLGLVNYFRAHVRDFAITAVPLYEMTEGYNEPKTRSKPLQWTDERIAAFESIKDAIRANPLLHFLDEQLPVSLATDASDYGIGAYLYQTRVGEDGQEEQIPIAFLSQAMTKVQRRWSTIEKECYAIWYALRKWEHLLRDIPFTIYTDHRNLKYLNTNTPKVVRWKLAIQEFDFKVRHIDGEANVVADTFSRLCTQDGEEEEIAFDGTSSGTRACEEDGIPDRLCSLTGVCSCAPLQENAAYLCGIVTSGPLGNVTPTAPLRKPQPRSRIVRKRRRKARPTSNSLETASSDSMIVDETTLHHNDDKEDNTDDEQQPVVVQNLHNIPHDEVHYQYFREVHNEMDGHMGFHLTMKRLKDKSRSWPMMRRDVKKFISECPTCQALRRLAPSIKALPYVTAAPAPMERISIDTMGPYTKSARGYEYILVVIDNFSRFVELYPITTVGAQEAAERLLEYVSRYGQPLQILSDGGTQFLNDTVQELCKLLQVTTIVATPYSKQENGIVERANKEVLRHLRAFLADSKILEAWPSYLPLIQRIMNSTPHKATGVPPAAILFGDATRLDRRVLFEDLPNENYDERTGEPLPPRDNMSPTLRAWIDRMLAAQHRIIQIAKQTQDEEQQRHVRMQTPDEAPVIFQPNEYVMCEYPDTAFGKQPPNKLLTPLRGPFRVVAYNPLRRQYELQHLNINKSFKVDPSKVHKFNYNPDRTNPAEVALRDKQEFYVSAIHGVRGNPKRRKTLEFLVEWEGYDERTWEPWSHLRHNTVLHQYLRNHPTRDLRKLSTIRDN